MSSLLPAAIVAVAALRAVIPTAENELDPPLAAWHGGPVKYLLTADEEREIRVLTDDAARKEFILRFWARRDPTAGTPENEVRDEFWRRVAQANRQFIETTKQGWKTDRGQIYILLGPPDEQDVDPVQKEGHGQIRWIYRSSPTRDTGPNEIIAFREDVSGEFRLSSNPRDYSLVSDFVTRSSLALGAAATAAEERIRARGMTSMQIAQDLTALGNDAKEDDLVAALVATEPIPDGPRFADALHFLRARDGSTFVTITLAIPSESFPADRGAESVLPMARLERLEPPVAVFDFIYRDPFVALAPPSAAGAALFQARAAVPPGRYRCFVGVFDRRAGRVSSRRSEIVVPAFPDGTLVLSSLILSAGPAAGTPHHEVGDAAPSVAAGQIPAPRIPPVVHNGEEFSLHYQVYGAGLDGGGRPLLAVEYLFLRYERDEAIPVGEPITIAPLREQALGWAFPLIGWPSGRFRLEVTVTDRVTARSTRAALEFTVAD